MASPALQRRSRKSLTLALTWLLTAGLFALTVENVWLDPWLKRKFPEFPSLVPEPPGAAWLLTFAAVGIVCVVLIVGQILLARRGGVSRKAKILAGITVMAAVALSVIWFLVTSGITAAPRLLSRNLQKQHTVTLTWKASTTPGVAYNVYRVNVATGKEEQVNDAPVTGLTYTDKKVTNGEKYIYYATAVSGSKESIRSNPAPAKIPLS